jgi:hypothetical protein
MFYDIFLLWLRWHFLEVIISIHKAWINFLRFNLYYFSIPVLVKTFFNHWHRYRMPYKNFFVSPGSFFEALTFNLLSRIIGAILRLFFILIGSFLEILIFIFGIFLIFLWLFLPFLSILLFIIGLSMIIL